MKTYSEVIYDYKMALQRRFIDGKINVSKYDRLTAKLNEWLAYSKQ